MLAVTDWLFWFPLGIAVGALLSMLRRRRRVDRHPLADQLLQALAAVEYQWDRGEDLRDHRDEVYDVFDLADELRDLVHPPPK